MKASKNTPGPYLTISLALLLLGRFALASGRAQGEYDFYQATTGAVYTLAIQPDNKILVGAIRSPGRLNSDGSWDPSIRIGLGSQDAVYTVALLEDGQLLVGGAFKTLQNTAITNLARLHQDGTVDPNFAAALSGQTPVFAVTSMQDGGLLTGGSFFDPGGAATESFGRLNSDGSLDPAFVRLVEGTVFSAAVDSKGKITVGGYFNVSGSPARSGLVRLNLDGTLDNSFVPPPFPEVESMAVQSDGKTVVSSRLSADWKMVYRLNVDGSMDSNFNCDLEGRVNAIAVRADGKMLVGGAFTNVEGLARCSLVMLNTNGMVQQAFSQWTNATLYSIALQPDGRILVGGINQIDASNSEGLVARLPSTDIPQQDLSSGGSSITWARGGACPDLSRASFQFSTNGVDWTSPRPLRYVEGAWRVEGVTLPPGAVIRARGWVATGNFNGTCWFVEATTQVPVNRPLILAHEPRFGIRSGHFGFQILGAPGSEVVVESSADLLNWAPLSTNTLGSTPVEVVDDQPVNGVSRFYRARLSR